MFAPAALAALTVFAALFWTVRVVVVPQKVRASLEEGLSPFFPSGFDFDSASRIGPGRYRMRAFRAYASGRIFPWLESPAVDITTAPDGTLDSVVLASARFDLDHGPDFIPKGGFILPKTVGRLPALKAQGAEVYFPLPFSTGVKFPIIRALNLDFAPEGKTGKLKGSFGSVLGSFEVLGTFAPGARSNIRAVLGRDRTTAGVTGNRSIGPLVLSGEASGAFTLIFGGGERLRLAGNVSSPEASIEGVDSRFESVRIMVKSQEVTALGIAIQVEAARGTVGFVTLERISAKGPAGFSSFSGRAEVWGGPIAFRGATVPSLYLEGRVEGMDLARMPPDLLGAATPSSGKLSADFRVKGEELSGDFRISDAGLWNVPFLSGVSMAAARFGGTGSESFRNVEGSFAAKGAGVTVKSLKLEGRQIGLELEGPGRIAPDRRIFFNFAIHLMPGEDRGKGLPPFVELFNALNHAIADPIARALSFHMSITGTLDKPVHRILGPPGRR